MQSDVEGNDNNYDGCATGNIGMFRSPERAELNDLLPPSGSAASNFSVNPNSGMHATAGGTSCVAGSSCCSIPDSPKSTAFVDVPDGGSVNVIATDAKLLSMKNKSPTLLDTKGNGDANNNRNAASLLAAAIAASAASTGGCRKQHRSMLMRLFEQSNHASEFLPSANDGLVLPPPRRSKSLKASMLRNTAKSPVRKKKIVRFADALGLDLSEVKMFCKQDIPHPSHAGLTSEFDDDDDDDESLKQQGILNGKSSPSGADGNSNAAAIAANDPLLSLWPRGPSLIALFSSPGLADDFIDRVRDSKVCLESITISETKIDGFVRVLNVAFVKEVFLRYTFNEWQSIIGKQAQYSESKNDGFTDRFAFTFYAPPHMSRGAFLEFSICYRSGGAEWWDNNYGRNYRLECFDSSCRRG